MRFLSALVLLGLVTGPAFAHASPVETYGIHLFFNEREFIDVMTLEHRDDGALTGAMHVPNDFDGPLLNTATTGENLSFDLNVPANASRPQALVFHYEGRFFDTSHDQLIGFVTLKGESGFIASFTGFRRK